MNDYETVSGFKEFFPSSNRIDSSNDGDEEMMDMTSDLSEAMLEEVGLVEDDLVKSMMKENSQWWEDTNMFKESTASTNWVNQSNLVETSDVDNTIWSGAQSESQLGSNSETTTATEPGFMQSKMMDLEFLLNPEVTTDDMETIDCEPANNPETNLKDAEKIPKPEITNGVALKPEAEKVEPAPLRMSANESKCRQCGRAFKNASALHNHTRKGTKCKTGGEMNLSKPKIQRKHSFLQNQPKWSKSLASPSFEGGMQSKKNDTTGDPNGLKCKVRPGMVFKNNTSLRADANGHNNRDGWLEDGMFKGFQKTRSAPKCAEAGLPFSKDLPVVQSFSNPSSSAEGIT